MPTRKSNTERDLVKDGKHVVAMLDKHLAAFEEYEKPRSRKVITAAFREDLRRDVNDLERAINGQPVIRTIVSTATGNEEAQRQVVYDLLVQFRKDVNATPTAGAALQAAVGVGKIFNLKSTQNLQGHAGTLIEFAADKTHKAALAEAGITDKKIQELQKANQALGEADTHQDTAQSARRTKTLTKRQLVTVVKQGISKARASAEAASTPSLNLVEIFKSVMPRHTPTPRAPKTADAAAAGGEVKTKKK